MTAHQKESELIVSPKLLVAVLITWLLAIPIIIFVYERDIKLEKSEIVLGTGNQQIAIHEVAKDTVIEGLNFEQTSTTFIPTYSISICKDEYCMAIPNEVVQSLISGSRLDRDKFDEYKEKNIVPFFESKYGKKEIVKNRKGTFLAKIEDVKIVYSNIYDKVNSSFISGLTDIRIDLDTNLSPGTDGKYADKYIEIDNSQQRLYVWHKGKVEKTIMLSGPVYGYQVYGVFPIVDKGREPIAPGGKYMPYWMAFYYSKKQNSWYGLHALIWGYNEDGSMWYEPEKNIGTRQSAGCIRMLLDDAKWLYQNFEKGDLILIHE